MSQGRLERAIAVVFRTGIAVSSTCLAAGLLLSLLGRTGTLDTVLMQTGLVVLLATPAARVVVSVVEYVLDRDWMFVVLTSIVLAELIASVVAAAGH